MNDFTIEELRSLEHYIESYYDYHNPRGTLYNKIQSMIANYCEHAMFNSAAEPKCCKCGALQ